MRTSINLPDALLSHAKSVAASRGTTLTRLIEEGLRTVLEEDARAGNRSVEPLPAYGVEGARPLIDISDRAALWEALDEDGG